VDEFIQRSGALYCEDVPLAAIAEAVGTPTFVYSAASMRSQARLLRDALPAERDPLIAFAVKANPNRAVLATLAAEGLGADVVSGGEYLRARLAGVPGERIVFSGVGKTPDEMKLVLQGGLFQFNLESFNEAETLSAVAQAMGVRAPACFRVNPDVAAGTHAKISTGGAHDKFGISPAELLDAFARADSLPGIELKGIAVHIGSQLTDLAPLEAAFRKVGELIATLREAGHRITVADLGGGLGVAYDPGAPVPPSAAAYGEMVGRVTREWDVRLVFEPGRLLVGNAGVLLTRVIRVKPGPSRPFVVVDAAMNDLMRPTLYDAWHGIEAVGPVGETMVADIVGPVCESGDTFAKARTIDRVEAGELMVIRSAGAYAATMGSNYNSRTFPAEVLVDGDRWAVVRERQPFEALVVNERLPAWLEGAPE
jgi:diaminopimelate decarboxylase